MNSVHRRFFDVRNVAVLAYTELVEGGHITLSAGRMRARARLAAEAASSLKLLLFSARVGASHCSTIAGSRGSQGIAVTAFCRPTQEAWKQCSVPAGARSFHTSIITCSKPPESPPPAQATSLGSPAEPSTTKAGSRQSGLEPVDEEEGLFHMPQLLDDADFEDQDVPVMDVPGSRPPKPDLVQQYLSQDHFSAAEQYKWRKHELITEMQEFEHDTGTMPVQIGLLSERIAYLTKHTLIHRKDHAGRRGLLILLSRRRKMLKYLRKKDFDAYVKVLGRFKLKDNYYQSGWGEQYRVGTSLKWLPDQPGKQALPDASEMRQRLRERIQKRRIQMFQVGTRTMTKTQKEAERRSQEITKNRVLALNEGWVKKQLPVADAGGRKKRFEWVKDESLDAWTERLQECKKWMPEELNKPEFELQRLQAAAQRRELDEEGMQALQKLREAKRAQEKSRRHEEREKLRSSVLPKYGSPRGGAAIESLGGSV